MSRMQRSKSNNNEERDITPKPEGGGSRRYVDLATFAPPSMDLLNTDLAPPNQSQSVQYEPIYTPKPKAAVSFDEVLHAPQNLNKKRSRSRSASAKQAAITRVVRNNALITVKPEKKPLKENKAAAMTQKPMTTSKKSGQERERGVGVVKKFKK